MNPVISDEQHARRVREALALLGWESPECLPGEPAACGGSITQHIAAYYGIIQAVTDFYLEHWDDAGRRIAAKCRTAALAELRRRSGLTDVARPSSGTCFLLVLYFVSPNGRRRATRFPGRG